jgi:hypothetical protein
MPVASIPTAETPMRPPPFTCTENICKTSVSARNSAATNGR